MTPEPSTEQQCGEPVLLWDVDNMPGGRGQLLSVARALSSGVGLESPRIAGAHRVTYRRRGGVLRQFGFEVVSGGRSASGADRQLCDRGRTLHRLGHHEFVVASNDKYFARLAKIGTLHVLTLDETHLSRRLAAAATTITVLAFDGSTWTRRRFVNRSPPASWSENRVDQR